MDLFSHIESQTTSEDRVSLLAIQEAVRTSGPYTYLEIGSHLGGTIQTHIADPLCRRIWSIDKRPLEQPDERGRTYRYEENSTQRMINGLSTIPGADLEKLRTFDLDASEVPAGEIELTPTYCLVDAEHTDRAIQSDFAFCSAASGGKPVFLSHDSYIVYRGLKTIIDGLSHSGNWFRVLFLPSHFFLIDTVGVISDHPVVRARSLEGWRGYLEGMMINHWYKQEYLKMCPDSQAIAI